MPILNHSEIIERLKLPIDKKERLVVTPLLNIEEQIKGPGIDLRLSNDFIVFKPENMQDFDIKRHNPEKIKKFQSSIVVPFFQPFVLHPNTLVLASTLEYVSMPLDLFGLLEGRSSWARLGLIIATACAIDPGYKGTITLELTNLGEIPILLYPGARITKLILSKTSSESDYENRKYNIQIGPEFSKIHEDKELRYFTGGKK